MGQISFYWSLLYRFQYLIVNTVRCIWSNAKTFFTWLRTYICYLLENYYLSNLFSVCMFMERFSTIFLYIWRTKIVHICVCWFCILSSGIRFSDIKFWMYSWIMVGSIDCKYSVTLCAFRTTIYIQNLIILCSIFNLLYCLCRVFAYFELKFSSLHWYFMIII